MLNKDASGLEPHRIVHQTEAIYNVIASWLDGGKQERDIRLVRRKVEIE
jgi:hypothetical protein